ncbi:Cell wall synthesis protein [Wickerhamomyces ciferrii]|uniref:Cell wall synthesis protein n=1 Tax=Wickerhamomyces ciferrii (strain ATCC 14091 / BCRC 22168 / CBS 111 / JCM 3599 / NBRC 0793 / NRRL Y-1031 F-60-10) TaxID=1206466 RepID=K0L015_WICCF|nr:Cell wall synthesis protein [Wickerhamomyces ciferrii]CCH46949.1 Cell wall synthesis protein [Wickerhamomyces ciferrii]
MSSFKLINSKIFNFNIFIITILLLINSVFSDVSPSKPLKGASFTVSGGTVSIPVSWIESNAEPKLDDIESYTFTLCSGPNSNIHAVATLEQAVKPADIDDTSIDLTVEASAGASGNYYIQIYAKSAKGFTINYTNRFSLKGMTGSYQPNGNDASPPSGQTSLAGDDNGPTNTGDISKSFTIPYTMQTGKTRYAPMQTQPGTTVTRAKSDWTRKFQTSAFTYFTSAKHSQSVYSTITPGWSYTISSVINGASVAPMPTTWYHPSQRLSKATLRSSDQVTA